MIKALWLTSWYPNNLDAMNGDFVQRHAIAASLFCKVHVMHLEADKNNLLQQDVVIKKNTAGNLSETIVHYKPKQGSSFFSKISSLNQYKKLFKQQVKKYIEENGLPQVVHVHIPVKAGIIALWLKRKYKIPYAVTEHWTIYHKLSPDNYACRNYFFKYYTKKILSNASVFLPVSNNLGEIIRQTVTVTAYTKIPNAVNTEYFFYTPKDTTTDFTFIHASTYNYQKNAEAILRAFALLLKERPKAKLILAGDAPQGIHQLAASLNIPASQIAFTGLVSYAAVAKLLQQSHALVMFSRYENLPCIIAEALSCGIPVISTGVGGIPEMIDANNGILIANEDEHALLQAMLKMMNDYEQFSPASIAADAAAKYSYRQTGSEIAEAYKKIIQ